MWSQFGVTILESVSTGLWCVPEVWRWVCFLPQILKIGQEYAENRIMAHFHSLRHQIVGGVPQALSDERLVGEVLCKGGGASYTALRSVSPPVLDSRATETPAPFSQDARYQRGINSGRETVRASCCSFLR